MKLGVHLDTSVFSAYFDDRAPDRREQTLAFFDQLSELEACASELTRDELAAWRIPHDEGTSSISSGEAQYSHCPWRRENSPITIWRQGSSLRRRSMTPCTWLQQS